MLHLLSSIQTSVYHQNCVSKCHPCNITFKPPKHISWLSIPRGLIHLCNKTLMPFQCQTTVMNSIYWWTDNKRREKQNGNPPPEELRLSWQPSLTKNTKYFHLLAAYMYIALYWLKYVANGTICSESEEVYCHKFLIWEQLA